MNKSEYWFLNLVVEWRYPLDILESENLELLVNGPGHDLGHNELVATLLGLFQKGYLFAHLEMESDEESVPTVQEIEMGLSNEREIYYGLTAAGGALWESVSQPDWDRYIDAIWGIETDPDTGADIKSGEVISANHHTTEANFNLLPKYDLIESSIKWERLAPWKATYWKTLPDGHRVSYLEEFNLERDELPAGYDHGAEHAKREKLFKMQKWYIHPFEEE